MAVQIVDFFQVVALVSEQLLRCLVGVLQAAVLSEVVRLGVQVVEQLHKSLVELRNLDVGWTSFDFALENRDLPVLLSQCLLLSENFLGFSSVLRLDFLKNSCLLCGLHILLSLLDLLLFNLKPLLLFSAVLLELNLALCQTRLFFNQVSDSLDILLLDRRPRNLLLESSLFSFNLLNLFIVLRALVLKLFHFSTESLLLL